ncbi:MAG: hypothetical protein ACE366_19450 [Bradymonadia bacterium]
MQQLSWALALICLCASTSWSQPASQPGSQPTAKGRTMMKRPAPPIEYVDGPSIEPETLKAWLEKEVKPSQQIKLPIVITLEVLGVRSAMVSGDPSGASKGMPIKLDDSTMGISLMDHLRSKCPKDAKVCGIWIEGLWGGLMAGLSADPSSTLVIRKVGDVFTAPLPKPVKAQIEK